MYFTVRLHFVVFVISVKFEIPAEKEDLLWNEANYHFYLFDFFQLKASKVSKVSANVLMFWSQVRIRSD